MAKCKYCGETINRLDKDICPFCGQPKPLGGVDDSTEDFTTAFEPLNSNPIKQKSKIIAAILAFLLGVFGCHDYYLGKYKVGLITLGITFVFIGGLGTILFFTCLNNALAFLIPYFIIEALMIAAGIAFLVRHDIKDARGEFLK